MNSLFSSVRDTWGKMPHPVQIGVGILVLGVFVFFIFLTLFSNVEYEVLFSSLQPTDAGAVLADLQERGIPYRLADNGTTILVPSDQVLETRMSLASSGLPTGGVVGFEIFNTTRLGETDAERQLRYQWALQGELTRTIRQIDAISDARIHIVLPKRSLFIQDSTPSTASVLLQMRPGRELTNQQVRGITNLVSSSVEGLSAENVTIVDSRGNVLTASSSTTQLNGEAFAVRFEAERSYEQDLENSITAMLERIHGFGNVVTRVSATLDFDQYEEYTESYSPITRDGGLVRSQEGIEEHYTGTTDANGGVPGTDSNIPGYVTTDQNGSSQYTRTESMVNYELNRVETHLKGVPGSVKNLSVAVWLNGEFTPNQLASVEESVSTAVGLQPQRGDSIYVDSVPFETSALVSDVLLADFTEPSGRDYTPYIIPGIIGVFGLALGAFLLKRRRERAMAPVAATLDVEVGDEIPDLSLDEKEKKELRQKISAMAKEKPRDVAQLLRTWLVDE